MMIPLPLLRLATGKEPVEGFEFTLDQIMPVCLSMSIAAVNDDGTVDLSVFATDENSYIVTGIPAEQLEHDPAN